MPIESVVKTPHIYVIGVSKERRENGKNTILVDDFSKLKKDINLQIQKDLQTSGRINNNNITPRHIIVKLLSTKDEEKSSQFFSRLIFFFCKAAKMRLTSDFFNEKWEGRKQWHNFKLLKKKMTRL